MDQDCTSERCEPGSCLMRTDGQERLHAVQRSSSLSCIFRGSATCNPVSSSFESGGCSQLFRSRAMMHENLGSA